MVKTYIMCVCLCVRARHYNIIGCNFRGFPIHSFVTFKTRIDGDRQIILCDDDENYFGFYLRPLPTLLRRLFFTDIDVI